MSIRPLYDNVAVLMLDSAETKSEGGLIIPGINAHHNEGIVVAVGEGRLLQDGTVVAPIVQVGDHVLVRERGIPFESNGKQYEMYREHEIIGVFPVEAAEEAGE